MILKLKELREKYIKESKAKIAELLNVSVDDIKMYENDNLLLKREQINRILTQYNLDAIELSEEGLLYKAPEYHAWEPNRNEEINNLLVEQKKLVDTYNVIKNKEIENNSELLQQLYENKLLVLSQLLDKIKKPSVTLTGASSAGKSTMINHMLGDGTLPTNYTPTTSVSTKIIHIEDKPPYMEEKDNTAIFKIDNSNASIIETHKLNDEKYFYDHLVETGDMNIISDFGNHEGKKYKTKKKDFKNYDFVIVTYLDKPILKLCDIWDVPGTNVKTEDDYIANKSIVGADITLYLSTATQFMQFQDMQYITNLLKTLPNYAVKNNNINQFENLFIIASQANNVIKNAENKQSIKEILDIRIKELWESIDKKQITNKNVEIDFSFESIRNRGFSFDVTNESSQSDVKNGLLDLLEKLAHNRLNIINEFRSNEFQRFNETVLKISNDLKNQREAKIELDNFLENKERNKEKNAKLVEFIKEKAIFYKQKSIEDIEGILNKTLEVENIVNLIELKNFGKKKREKEQFSNWFQNELTYKVECVLTNYSEEFSKDINNELEKVAQNESRKVKVNQFNFVASFVGTLSSIATIGAFSFYFSTLGNLGGYIFLSQIVSGFSAMGISLGGTAAVASAVSVVGGPMTIVIGIAILAGGVVRGIVSQTAWKKDFAKKLVKAYNKKIKTKQADQKEYVGLTGKEAYVTQCEKFWDETIESIHLDEFNKKLDQTEMELQEKVKFSSKEIEDMNKKLEIIKFT
jgi:hypothetical protein